MKLNPCAEKFLVDKSGRIVKRYAPTQGLPRGLEQDIAALL